jgi:hypothetical protein
MVFKLEGTSKNAYVRLDADKSVPEVSTGLEVMGRGNTALVGSTGSDTLHS